MVGKIYGFLAQSRMSEADPLGYMEFSEPTMSQVQNKANRVQSGTAMLSYAIKMSVSTSKLFHGSFGK